MYDVSTEPQRTSAPSTHKIVLNAVPPTTFAMRPGFNSYLTVIQQSARLFHALPCHIHHNIFIYQLVHGFFTVSFGYKCQTSDHTDTMRPYLMYFPYLPYLLYLPYVLPYLTVMF